MRGPGKRRESAGRKRKTETDYQTLEPRKLLAADLQAVARIPDASSLIHQLSEPVPVEQRMDLLRDQLDLGPEDQFRLLQLQRDHLGQAHLKYQQYHRGIPVEGGVYTVHIQDRQVLRMSGDYIGIPAQKFDSAILSEPLAFQAALDEINANEYLWQDPDHPLAGGLHFHEDDPDHLHFGEDHAGEHLAGEELHFELPEGELVYLNAGGEQPVLTWKFDIFAIDPLSRNYVFVDVHSGEVVDKFDRIHTGDVPASGTSLYNGTVNFTADDTGAGYRLRQTTDGVETYDLNNTQNYGSATDITSPTSAFTDPDVHTGVQAHFGAEQTLEYFLTRHGRDSYDGNGATLRSYVSYGTNYVNAFWDGTRMTYGDGNGTSYGPLTSLDIVGHEIAHGVTQFSAGLIYRNESGALNESFSDIFGEAVENHALGSNDWLMGDDIGLQGSGAFRNMANPNAKGDPDTYLGDFWYTGTGDNGGVHINSGVQNKWFYILTTGEAGTNDTGYTYDVTGIGMVDAAEIAYRNLAVYLTPNSTYADARVGGIQAAIDLFGFGSPQHLATAEAWDAVGVYAATIDVGFTPVEGIGSLVYEGTGSGSLIDDTDVETITIGTDPGQVLSVVVTGDPGLIPNIEILDPAEVSLATATGTSATTVLQTAPLDAGGNYQILITAAPGTGGAFSVEFLLNAAVETEGKGGPGNNSMIEAQDLNDSAIALGNGGADRLAVVGTVATGDVLNAGDDFESGELGEGWTISTSSPNGQILVRNDLGAANGTSYALAMDVVSNGTYSLNEAVYTVDLSGFADATLSFYHAEWSDEQDQLPNTFTDFFYGDGVSISADGITWHTILNAPSGPLGVFDYYEFDLGQEAADAGISLGANFQIKFQQFDNFVINQDGRMFDEIVVAASNLDDDWYAFDLAAGQFASLALQEIEGTLSPQINLYDGAGTLLVEGVPTDNAASAIAEFVNPGEASTFYVEITGGSATYNLVITRDAVLDLEPNAADSPLDITDRIGGLGYVVNNPEGIADPDLTSESVLDTAFPRVTLSENLSGGSVYAATSSFTAPTGSKVLAPAPTAASGWRDADNQLRGDFHLPVSTISIDVGSDDSSDVAYLRAYAADGTLLEEQISSGVAEGGSETLTISRAENEIAWFIASGVGGDITPLDNLVYSRSEVDDDHYQIDVTTPTRIDLTAFLPGEGPLEFDNRLDLPGGSPLQLELLDSNGVVVATGQRSLTYAATVLGIYTVRVSTTASEGEYFLQYTPRPAFPGGIDFGPADSPLWQDYTWASTDAYTPEVGYGWTDSTLLATFESTRGNALARDKAVMRDGTFVVDVANGDYDVTVHFGVVSRRARARITLEDQTDTFFPNRGFNVSKTYQVTVNDGQLTLMFDGNLALDRRIRIAGIAIAESSSSQFSSFSAGGFASDGPQLLNAWNPSGWTNLASASSSSVESPGLSAAENPTSALAGTSEMAARKLDGELLKRDSAFTLWDSLEDEKAEDLLGELLANSL